jgi:hypothetical protein
MSPSSLIVCFLTAASCPRKDFLHSPTPQKRATDFCTGTQKRARKQAQKSQKKVGKKAAKKTAKRQQKRRQKRQHKKQQERQQKSLFLNLSC